MVDKQSKSNKREVQYTYFRNPKMIIYSDPASHQGWGAEMEGGPTTGNLDTGRKMDVSHKRIRINCATEIAIKTIYQTEGSDIDTYIHRQYDCAIIPNKKLGQGKSKSLIKIEKKIWKFALDKGITITASWIPSAKNTIGDRDKSRTPGTGTVQQSVILCYK